MINGHTSLVDEDLSPKFFDELDDRIGIPRLIEEPG
jgi:hypothetical protein